MSLVHDALQKAEREKLRKTGQIEPPAAPVSRAQGGSGVSAAIPLPVAAGTPLPPQQPSRRRLGILPTLIAAFVALAVGVFVWAVLRTGSDGRARSGATTAETPAAPPTTAARTEQAPAAPAAIPPTADDDPAYKLTGVMKDPDGKPCAIVNGRVVSEGHYVDGATVKKIERDRVTLDVNGREVVKRLY